MLMMRSMPGAQQYFLSSKAVWADGILGGLFTFVLFWTLFYGLAHLF